MSRILLDSLNDACRAYNHVVYREGINNGKGGFERAGKRHAIASFFGTSSAKALNRITLAKIKEALSAEENDGRRSCGSVASMDGLFASVDCDKRISSKIINKIIDNFKEGEKSDPLILNSKKKMFVSDLLTDANLSPLSPISVDMHIRGMERVLKGFEGSQHILRMIAEHCLDRELSDLDVEKAIASLQDVHNKKRLTSNVCTAFVNFIMSVGNAGSKTKDDFISIFRMVNGKNEDGYNAAVGSELCRIFDRWSANDANHDFSIAEEIATLCGMLKNADNVQKRIASNDNISSRTAYEMVKRFSAIDILDFTGEQLKELSKLSWSEMDRLNKIAGFEMDAGATKEDVYAMIMTEGSVLNKMIAYPELIDDAITYNRSVKLMKAFDCKIDGLIAEGGLQKLKPSTKWMLERFVFQDLCARIKTGDGLPDEHSFSVGLTHNNRFVRFAENMFGRSAMPWNMLCLSPELRIPVMAAMDAYGEYGNQYLLTRLIANGERVGKIYQEERLPDDTMTKEQVFRAINGAGEKFYPLIHENPEYWADKCDRECTWVIKEKGVTLDDAPNRYNRKFFMINDFIQRYNLTKEYVLDMAFQEDESGEGSFKYTEFAPVNAPLVVNDLSGGITEAVNQFERDFSRMKTGRFEVKFSMPEGDVCFNKTDYSGEQVKSVVSGVAETVMRMCGKVHKCQVENLILVLSQALEQDLFAAFASLECDPVSETGGISKRFEIARNDEDGSIMVHVSDMGNSAVRYDWHLKILADGTQEASDLIFSRNFSIEASWSEN